MGRTTTEGGRIKSKDKKKNTINKYGKYTQKYIRKIEYLNQKKQLDKCIK